jgi:hypothetical protein
MHCWRGHIIAMLKFSGVGKADLHIVQNFSARTDVLGYGAFG